MTYEQARDAMHERSCAAAGVTLDTVLEQRRMVGHSRAMVEVSPDEMVRRLLADLVPLEDLEALIDGLDACAKNEVQALPAAPTLQSAYAMLLVVAAQNVAIGLMMARPS